MIQFNDAHIGYTIPLIRIANMHLDTGNLYILIGRNGAGKSTLLKSIANQATLMHGSIRINGKSVNALTPIDIAKQIAFVSTVFPSVHFLRVRDYVALGRTPHTNAMGRLSAHDKARVDEAIKALDIEALQDKFTSDLSDGERQMVAIARAIAQETPVIVLDEPTAFLDYTNKIRVINLLKETATSMQKCILLSSHDIDISIDANCPFILLKKDTSDVSLVHPPILKENLLKEVF